MNEFEYAPKPFIMQKEKDLGHMKTYSVIFGISFLIIGLLFGSYLLMDNADKKRPELNLDDSQPPHVFKTGFSRFFELIFMGDGR